MVETNPDLDKKNRSIAIGFFRELVAFLKARPEKLMAVDNDFVIRAKWFWNHPSANNLLIKFTPSHDVARGTRMTGGIGHTPDKKYIVLVFSALLGPGDKSYLATRLQKDVVIHEVIHLLDPGFEKSKGGVHRYSAKGTSGGMDWDNYYNDPSEWNAMWQEGAAKAERLIKSDAFRENQGKNKAIRLFFGDGTVSGFVKSAHHIWNDGFLEHMNKKTKRKFDKRLAQLWKSFKEDGLL